jgi:hypothetical protein
MTARLWARLRDEGGQSLVFFVLTMTALFAMVALVVNVGNWLQARRHVQAVADSAALAAAQEDPHDIFAGLTRAQDDTAANWPGTVIESYFQQTAAGNPPNTFTGVTIIEHHDVPAIFSGFLDFFGIDIVGLRIKAQATARTEPPLIVNKVSPIALFCDSGCQLQLALGNAPWPVDTGANVSFQFTVGLPAASSFSPVAFPGVDDGNFGNYVTCDPLTNGSPTCNQQDVEASNQSVAACQPVADVQPCWYQRLKLADDPMDNKLEVLQDLQGAGTFPHLVAIYDDVEQDPPADPDSTYRYHVIGWASYAITSVVDTGTGIELNGTFHKLFLDSSQLSSGGAGGGKYDFGVRAVGLSK